VPPAPVRLVVEGGMHPPLTINVNSGSLSAMTVQAVPVPALLLVTSVHRSAAPVPYPRSRGAGAPVDDVIGTERQKIFVEGAMSPGAPDPLRLGGRRRLGRNGWTEASVVNGCQPIRTDATSPIRTRPERGERV
jgi:hypothetical protein